MSYIQNNLTENERIIFQSELHWVIFILPFIYTAAILAFIYYQKVSPLLNIAGALAIVYFFGEAWIRYLTVSYTLTNMRIIRKKGLFFTQIIDMSLDRIESASLEQSLLGRMLNYGDVIIYGTGGDKLLLDTLDDPSAFRQQVFGQLKKT